MPKVDFEKAYELAQQLWQLPSPQPELEKEFVHILMPLAERNAKSFATRTRGKQFASQLDYENCLSTTSEAIITIARNPPKTHPDSAQKFGKLCNIIMKRRFIDLQRSVLGTNKEGRPTTVSLDIEKVGVKPLRESITDNRMPEILSGENADHIKSLLENDLTDQQYRVVCAMMDYGPQGYEQREIAAILDDMNPSLFNSHLGNARKRLRETHPGLEQELSSLLGKDERAR